MSKIIRKILIFICLFIYIYSDIYQRPYEVTINNKKITYQTSRLIDEDTVIDIDLDSSDSNDVTFLVVQGTLTIKEGITVSKKITKSLENKDEYLETDDYKYGLNSLIVAIGEKSKVNIISSSLYVDSPLSHAIMAFNGAKLNFKNATITTKSKYSKGVVLAGKNSKAEIMENSKITTEGDFSPCLEINYGTYQVGTIHLNSKGISSPLINNIGGGEIMIVEGDGKASNSQIMVINGNNNVGIFNCKFSCKGKGDKDEENNNLNNGGIVIYREENINNEVVDLRLFNSEIKIEETSDIPLFRIYNSNAGINLDNTKIGFKDKFMIAQKDDNIAKLTINLEIKKLEFEKGIIEAGKDILVNISTDDPDSFEDALTSEGEGKIKIEEL